MIKSEKRLKELGMVLGKDNPALVAEAIELLRDEEPFEGAVALVASCYSRHSSMLVRKAVENFFNDIKDVSLRPELVQEIRNGRDQGTTSMLVSSCWQSGIDYSDYFMDFTEIFLQSDYGIAFECFTVIEEMIPELSQKQKESIIGLVRDNLDSAGIKKPLCIELLSLLES